MWGFGVRRKRVYHTLISSSGSQLEARLASASITRPDHRLICQRCSPRLICFILQHKVVQPSVNEAAL